MGVKRKTYKEMEIIKANKYAPNVHIGSIKSDIDDALADILMRNVNRETVETDKYASNVHIGSQIDDEIDDEVEDEIDDVVEKGIGREIVKANKYAPNIHIGSIRSDIDDIFNDIFKLER